MFYIYIFIITKWNNNVTIWRPLKVIDLQWTITRISSSLGFIELHSEYCEVNQIKPAQMIWMIHIIDIIIWAGFIWFTGQYVHIHGLLKDILYNNGLHFFALLLHWTNNKILITTQHFSGACIKSDTDCNSKNQYSRFLQHLHSISLIQPKCHWFSKLNTQQLKCAIKADWSAKAARQWNCQNINLGKSLSHLQRPYRGSLFLYFLNAVNIFCQQRNSFVKTLTFVVKSNEG